MLQLRQKGLDSGAMLAAALSLVPICRKHGVPLIINDRVDIALASDADGVHVGQVCALKLLVHEALSYWCMRP